MYTPIESIDRKTFDVFNQWQHIKKMKSHKPYQHSEAYYTKHPEKRPSTLPLSTTPTAMPTERKLYLVKAHYNKKGTWCKEYTRKARTDYVKKQLTLPATPTVLSTPTVVVKPKRKGTVTGRKLCHTKEYYAKYFNRHPEYLKNGKLAQELKALKISYRELQMSFGIVIAGSFACLGILVYALLTT